MHDVLRKVAVGVGAFALVVSASGVASATPEPAGGAGVHDTTAVRQADLEWKLVGVYPTYDDCYWDGFDGWNNHRWDRWICPESSGLFWLMVGDN